MTTKLNTKISYREHLPCTLKLVVWSCIW